MRPICQWCKRRPGRRIKCLWECGRLVGPGCCLLAEFRWGEGACIHCKPPPPPWLVVEATFCPKQREASTGRQKQRLVDLERNGLKENMEGTVTATDSSTPTSPLQSHSYKRRSIYYVRCSEVPRNGMTV